MQIHNLIQNLEVANNTTYYSPTVHMHKPYLNEKFNTLAMITHSGAVAEATTIQVSIQGSDSSEGDNFNSVAYFVGDYSLVGWIRQGVAKATNVDFVGVGDSNTIYSPGNGGYLSAIWNWANTNASIYSTALYPQIAPGTMGWVEPRAFFADPADNQNQSGIPSFYSRYLSAGSTSVPAGKPVATGGNVNGYGAWRTHGQENPNTAFYRQPGSGQFNPPNGNESLGLVNVSGTTPHPLFNNAVTYRATYGVFNAAETTGGEFMLSMNDLREPRLEWPLRPSNPAGPFVRTSNLSTYRGVGIAELNVPGGFTLSNTGGDPIQGFTPFANIAAQGSQYGNETRIQNHYVGYWQSVYRKAGGFAVNSLEVEGGRPGRYQAEALMACPDKALDLYLSEIRNRQVGAMGKPGKVIIFVQNGINDRIDTTLSCGPNPAASNTAAGFIDNFEQMRIRITERWVAQGFSEEDLGFLVMVAHPVTSTDNTGDTVMQQFNNGIKAYYAGNKNRVLVYDVREGVGNGAFFNAQGYHASPDSHLTSGGYNAVVADFMVALNSDVGINTNNWTTLAVITPNTESSYYGANFTPTSNSFARYVASAPYMRFSIRNTTGTARTFNADLLEKF